MGLFKPAWQSENPKKRLKAVEKLVDQAAIAIIAKNEYEDRKIRMVAVEKLTDQAVLADIARNSRKRDVCIAAVKSLTDQSTLAELAKIGIYDDPYDRADIVRKNDRQAIRRAVVSKITDQTVLSFVAKTEKVEDIRNTAVSKLTNEELSQQIQNDINIANCSESYLQSLTDQSILTDIAKGNKNYNVRVAAADMLTDKRLSQQLYSEIITECASGLALATIEKLTSQDELAYVARHAKDGWVRLAAINKIDDKSTAIRLLENILNPDTPTKRLVEPGKAIDFKDIVLSRIKDLKENT